ncbi:DUF996 domain-containing protein [Vulcanisaeta thermophila]|uniref:DUF996 domain-containing protein n=1 Tax=Vulcanisaeta thermophila TaxID=867917 RepID=UPI000853C4D7|nr:DUF996 domain-containing protein [Vulcanisaeta thermophila]
MASSLNIESIRSAGLLGLVGVALEIISSIVITVSHETTYYVDTALGIMGLLAVLTALHKLSRAYNSPDIFRHALYGAVTIIVGWALVTSISALAVVGISPTAHLIGLPIMINPTGTLGLAITLWVVFYIFTVIAYAHLRNAYTELTNTSNINNFRSAAKWYWYGALTYVVAVGEILVLLGDLYALVGYNKLRRL